MRNSGFCVAKGDMLVLTALCYLGGLYYKRTPLVDNIPANDKNAVELSVMSDIVIAYEKEHYPIKKTTVAELIEFYLEEKGMS